MNALSGAPRHTCVDEHVQLWQWHVEERIHAGCHTERMLWSHVHQSVLTLKFVWAAEHGSGECWLAQDTLRKMRCRCFQDVFCHSQNRPTSSLPFLWETNTIFIVLQMTAMKHGSVTISKKNVTTVPWECGPQLHSCICQVMKTHS